MMAREKYGAQVDLLVRTIPIIAQERQFALKGGTAINLFYRDMPRLSVDIDLVYLPLDERQVALANIDAGFDRIAASVGASMRNVKAQRAAGGGNGDTRILISGGDSEIKVEVSPVARGIVGEAHVMRVTEAVEDAFGFAAMAIAPFEDVYAGKLVAALDRQHPRDLYDVHLLYENEGITDPLFRTFLVYASFSGRPLHEILNPNPQDISDRFAKEFEGMTLEPVPLETLIAARTRLIKDIQSRLNGPAAEFLLSMQGGNPNFDLIDLPQAADLPAIKWKLMNLQRLRDGNPKKYDDQSARLHKLLVN